MVWFDGRSQWCDWTSHVNESQSVLTCLTTSIDLRELLGYNHGDKVQWNVRSFVNSNHRYITTGWVSVKGSDFFRETKQIVGLSYRWKSDKFFDTKGWTAYRNIIHDERGHLTATKHSVRWLSALSKHSIAYQKQHRSVNGSDIINPLHSSSKAFKSGRPKCWPIDYRLRCTDLQCFT